MNINLGEDGLTLAEYRLYGFLPMQHRDHQTTHCAVQIITAELGWGKEGRGREQLLLSAQDARSVIPLIHQASYSSKAPKYINTFSKPLDDGL